MRPYAITDVIFLLGVGTAVIVLAAVRRSAVPWVSLIVGGVGLVTLTAVFDNVMIAVGLFRYRTDTLAGLTVGLAPLEDFAYPVAAAVLLPTLWLWLRRTDREVEPEEPT
ncbi:lycopene cyclase domain-containing protein [Sinomonas sp. G460-2]|uniref:lycopene cyclase domain-containing protein n=1 Tax=Sinomonas sp. G460-2 TaxID=3393464 RepID=UPI0039F07CAE